MIFVDTSAWYARIVPSDPNHQKSVEWTEKNTEPLITTDFIIDEILTLLKARKQIDCAFALGEAFFQGDLTKIYFLSEEEIVIAWNIFHDFKDKDWSFTDCTSNVILRKLSIQKAFAFDQHFHQFGTVDVFP